MKIGGGNGYAKLKGGIGIETLKNRIHFIQASNLDMMSKCRNMGNKALENSNMGNKALEK